MFLDSCLSWTLEPEGSIFMLCGLWAPDIPTTASTSDATEGTLGDLVTGPGWGTGDALEGRNLGSLMKSGDQNIPESGRVMSGKEPPRPAVGSAPGTGMYGCMGPCAAHKWLSERP